MEIGFVSVFAVEIMEDMGKPVILDKTPPAHVWGQMKCAHECKDGDFEDSSVNA